VRGGGGALPPPNKDAPVFHDGEIHDVVVTELSKFHDPRGWLAELFRSDQIPEWLHPTMGYLSMTEPAVARGPHEHVDQTDYFCFLGPSEFKVHLWDARQASPTHGVRQVLVVGQGRPCSVVVPPGVVHAYVNVGDQPGAVLNFPNRLFRGPGKQGEVDEIRHENDAASPYRLD